MIYAVDFDRCLSFASWPAVGLPNRPLIEYLIRCRLNGDKLILWTCRTGEALNAAVTFCKDQGLEFDAVNENLPELIERYGNDPRKINADLYIDDKCMEVTAFMKRHCTKKRGTVRSIRVRG